MPAGDEVLCAVRDVESGAQIVRLGAALASTLGLRLVVVHARRSTPLTRRTADDSSDVAASVAALAEANGAEVRVHDGVPLAVLQGLGRALGTAWMVVGDGRAANSLGTPVGETTRRLLDASGCPLLVVSGSREADDDGPVACLIDNEFSTQARALAARLADALDTSVIAVHLVTGDNAETEALPVTAHNEQARAFVITGYPRSAANAPATSTRTAALLDAASEVLVIRQSALDRRDRAVGSLA